ncbi:MAG: hypothetical protein ACI3ZK_04020, partial [Candidatus Cryptobacteroides sp.]
MELSNLQIAAIIKMALRVADIDGNSTEDEYRVILDELKYFGLNSEQVISDTIDLSNQFSMNDALSIVSNLPDDQKREVCAFLGAIICADGYLGNKEAELWNKTIQWLDFPDMTLEDAVRIYNREDNSSSVKRINFKNGGYYEGEVSNGLYHGKGKIVFNNGDIREGSFTYGKMNGYGTYTWASGAKYVGEFEDNCMQGFGEYFYPNGDRYKGGWYQDKRNGFG